MAISKSTRQVSTHASTRKGGARAVRVPDSEALVRFAETLKLRTLAHATQSEYLRFVRKLAAQHGGDPSVLDEARRLLGAELGFVGVLHTWGRQLQHHPHVHYIVPGGGLSPDGRKWVSTRQPDWLLPGQKLAAVFRRRLEEALRAEAPAQHASIPVGTWRGPWVVHTQPAGSGAAVVRYLARYVGRTAISDERIVAADDHAVTFRYTDPATQQRKACTLTADEFLQRYLQHVPPPGQHRVRYFGWLHPAAQLRRMKVETLLAKPIVVAAPPPEATQWHLCCPHCEHFSLVRVGSLPRQTRAPPHCTR